MVVAVAKTPVEKADELARVRSNQRRSRARRKEYVQELEERVRRCERQGVQATAEVQAAARKIAAENAYLRQLLQKNGIWDHVLTKPAGLDLMPANAPHFAMPFSETMDSTKLLHDQYQRTSPQHSPLSDPGVYGNYNGMVSTPPASLPDETCGSQHADPGSGSLGGMGNWSMAPDMTAHEAAVDFQLPLPAHQAYAGAEATSKVIDIAVSSVTTADATYGAQTYSNPSFAGMLAAAYHSQTPSNMWPGVTSSGGAGASISPHFTPPDDDMFAALHHRHRTDHEPPPLSISHTQ
ncbi:hypothetical protein BST61_g3755 [Cercospora zeina]